MSFSVELRIAVLSLACFVAPAQELRFTRLETTQPAPSARIDGVIEYDAAGSRLILFGGQDSSPRNDLWAFVPDTGGWMELSPSGPPPPARFGHTMVYDSVRRRMVVFGGQAGGFFSDVWAYDLAANSWRQLAPDNAGPSRRYGHSAIYDAARDRMIVSHGFTDAGRFDDTWEFRFDTNVWRDVSPTTGRPLRRCLHHSAYDAAGDRMFLFGGCASGFGPCPLGDLWSYHLRTHRWTELRGSVTPPSRQWYGAAFDSARRRFVLFGGSGGGNLADTWEFDAATDRWSEVRPGGDAPAARSRHQGTYASERQETYFFGGSTAEGLTNELLRLDAARRPVLPDGGYGNAFSGATGAVAPGEIVSLFGAELGPEEGVVASFDESGALPVSLGGVAVLFDGTPAPLYYAGGGQINVQVPTSIAGRDGVSVVVRNNDVTSVPLNLPVAAAHPGLYPLVFRADFSVNGPTNPVRAGDAIVLFATGTGDGSVALSIGGRSAELLYAGPAPGTIGVTQVNAVVPTGIEPSDQVAVELRAGEAVSNRLALALR